MPKKSGPWRRLFSSKTLHKECKAYRYLLINHHYGKIPKKGVGLYGPDRDPQAQTQSHRDHPVVGAYRVERTVRLCIKDRRSPFPPYQYVVQLTQHTRSSVLEHPSLAHPLTEQGVGGQELVFRKQGG
ncbi:hypothetical protein NHX12_024884 [Muraenolepis orangiensis]|uniref:Uncharacterized protein n=1 Tax=Muraenolepis orangiensis TaxID=630683 RepID=A0A9Q0ELU0_9TELE|nr:hypothetical protein NHX12_024884 [Muraenolepis orangiensis]